MAAALFSGAFPQAEAQTPTTLVSNINQGADNSNFTVNSQIIQAQKFTTGDSEGGYTLTAVDVSVNSLGPQSSPRVSIYTVDSSGNPASSLHVLTNPATLAAGINTFTAPANATLEKETDYFVVFEDAANGPYDLDSTSSDGEDSGAAGGWSIANEHHWRQTSWHSNTKPLQIAIKGSARTTTAGVVKAVSTGLARAVSAGFGRMVAGQAMDLVSAHLEGGEGSHVTVGGERLGGFGEEALGRLVAAAHEDDGRRRAGRELLIGSSFRLAAGGGETGVPATTAWGRVAAGRFETASHGTATEGTVTTAMLGADVSRGRWLAGGALSLSRGRGTFAPLAGPSRDEGEAETRLAGIHPYAKVRLGERVSAWGLAGFATGELTLTAPGGRRVETDLRMQMGAAGARGTLVHASGDEGFELALETDALWMQARTDVAEGLPGTKSVAHRARLALDASYRFETPNGATLVPRLEVGVRRDGGDTETGTGVEVGAGLRYARSGLSVEGRARTLVAHEASGYEEWGASATVRLDPGSSGRGLSLTLAPTLGAASSEVERLWSAPDAGALARGADFEARRHLDAEVGYGLGGPHGLGTVTPFTGLGVAGEGERAWRAGARWRLAPDVTLGLEGTRREASGTAAPAHDLMLRAALRW